MRGKCIAPIFHPFNVVFLNKFLHFNAFYDRTKKSVVPLKPTMTVFKNKRRRLKCQTVNSCPRVILKPKMTFFKRNVIVCRRVFFPNVMETVFCSSVLLLTNLSQNTYNSLKRERERERERVLVYKLQQ